MRFFPAVLLLATIGFAQAPRTEPKPLDKIQVLALLAGGVPSQRVATLVKQRGIDFEPTDDYLDILQGAGAEDTVLNALRGARPVARPDILRGARPVARPDIYAAAATTETQVEQHLARGKGFRDKRAFAQAEEEFRAAVHLDPRNGDLHLLLGTILYDQARWHEAIAEYRRAVQLKPDSAIAYSNLGVALEAAIGRPLFGEMDPTDRHSILDAYRNAYSLMPNDPIIRDNYERWLLKSWPSLAIDPRAPLPTSWVDVWRFYVAHWHGWSGGYCHGQLSVGNGRITYRGPGGRDSVDWALSELGEVRKDSLYDLLILRHRNGKKFEFMAEDRLGDQKPTAPLLDAILQATGR
ncbi:MAG: tetratricopeptide repeat protein [Acidobacteriia bacterium]|nr:tetratricopeptide repeat protein [Terriglobia bacterium]